MDTNIAMITTRRYCCAICWGHLLAFPGDDGGLDVVCARSLADQCDGKGFVTQRYAEQRRQESYAELDEVLMAYPQLRPARRKVTTAQVLSELGY
jgi:hypothetical protein